MICPKCGNPVGETHQFCPTCGTKLIRCKYCLHPIEEGHHFCANCGRALDDAAVEVPPTSNDQIQVKDEKYPGYYKPLTSHTSSNDEENIDEDFDQPKINYKKIIISVCVLVFLTGVAAGYIQTKKKVEGNISKTSDIIDAITNENPGDESNNANLNIAAGLATFNNGNYYVVENNTLYKVDEKTLVSTKLKDKVSGYVQVVENKLYYCDDDYKLHRCTLDGQDDKVILVDAVYYVHVYKDDIYYQLDKDNESIYVYHFENNESEKLVDKHAYNLTLVDNHLYYSSKDGIYDYNLKTKSNDRIVENENIATLIYNSNKLYYNTKEDNDYHIYNYDIVMQSNEKLLDDALLLNMTDTQMYYLDTDAKTVYKYDLASANKVDTSIVSTSLCIVNNKIIADTYKMTSVLKQEKELTIFELDGTKGETLIEDSQDNGSYV